MELIVFDLELNQLGIIDDYIEQQFEIHYTKMSGLILTITNSLAFVELLQEDRILVREDDLEHGFIVKNFEYIDDKQEEIRVIAPSINILLNDRIVLGQQTFTGVVETVIKSFVDVNAVNPKNINRIIPNLICAPNSGIDALTTEGARDVYLDDFCYEICNKYDMSWNLLIDHEHKNFIFTTWQGMDKSSEQAVNEPVAFSRELDNILNQQYIKDDLNHKTTAIVLGEGEGGSVNAKVIVVNDELSGFARKEVLIEAKDLNKIYQDKNGKEVILTEVEYESLLFERGKTRLVDYQQIRTFECEIDLYSQFVYRRDYKMGDRISIENDELGIVMHTRIISAVETYKKSGENLKLDFGSDVPTFLEKVRKAVK